mgnify:CR=1 FL=1
MPSEFEYVFPSIRGVQAGREYYVSMCPLRIIPKIFLFNEEELVPLDPFYRNENIQNISSKKIHYYSSRLNKKEINKIGQFDVNIVLHSEVQTKISLFVEKLDKLLESAAGKTMSWLASRFGVRVDTLIPALLDAKRLAEVSATLAMPAMNDDVGTPVEEVPSTPSLAEMEEYAAIILEERADDSFEIKLSVLAHMAGGAHDEEVLRSLLSKQQAVKEDPEPEVVEEPEVVVDADPEPTPIPLAVEPLPPEESPLGGFIETPPPVEVAPPPSNLMEAFEALRQEVVALRAELKELKTPRGSVTLDDLIAAGATISIEPRK